MCVCARARVCFYTEEARRGSVTAEQEEENKKKRIGEREGVCRGDPQGRAHVHDTAETGTNERAQAVLSTD